MAPQAYMVDTNHAYEISLWENLSILIHGCTPDVGRINGDVWSDLATLPLQLEYFIVEFSYFKNKLTFMEKLSLKKILSYST